MIHQNEKFSYLKDVQIELKHFEKLISNDVYTNITYTMEGEPTYSYIEFLNLGIKLGSGFLDYTYKKNNKTMLVIFNPDEVTKINDEYHIRIINILTI